jgi:hypothetical protein
MFLFLPWSHYPTGPFFKVSLHLDIIMQCKGWVLFIFCPYSQNSGSAIFYKRKSCQIIMKRVELPLLLMTLVVFMFSSFTCWVIHQSIHFQIQNTLRWRRYEHFYFGLVSFLNKKLVRNRVLFLLGYDVVILDLLISFAMFWQRHLQMQSVITELRERLQSHSMKSYRARFQK